MAGADHRRETRGAEAVDRDAADGVGKAGEQRCEAGDVPVVLARLVRAAEPDVLDLVGGTPGAGDRLGDRERREVVGPHRCEPTAVAADRRPHCGQDRRRGSSCRTAIPLQVVAEVGAHER